MAANRMMKIALAVSLLAASACSKKDAPAGKPSETASEPAGAGKGPAMWAVSDDDTTAYLFGTFHVLPEDTKWTTPAFEEAMAKTKMTIVEVDTKSTAEQLKIAALVQELGLNDPGVTLSLLLGPERAARFSAVVRRYDLSMAPFERMKPWLAMITLSVTVMQKEGYSAASGAEEIIMAQAVTEGDKIDHLESSEYQIRALASLDEDEILADFDASLNDYENFDAYSERVIGAWTAGDVVALEREALSEMRAKSPISFRIMITERNANWAREIETMMAGEDDYFIAVGVGHLLGEGSVVDLLEKAGYKVTRVQ